MKKQKKHPLWPSNCAVDIGFLAELMELRPCEALNFAKKEAKDRAAVERTIKKLLRRKCIGPADLLYVAMDLIDKTRVCACKDPKACPWVIGQAPMKKAEVERAVKGGAVALVENCPFMLFFRDEESE